MKKILPIIILLFIASACSEIKAPMPAEPEKDEVLEGDATPTTWEEVDGYVAERTEEGGKEKILLIEGITQKEALEENSQEILSNNSDENAIWLTDEEIEFQAIQKGDAVTAWWDTAQPHQEPGILTVPAEKVEIATFNKK